MTPPRTHRVFLGGTAANNPWRRDFLERMAAAGVPRSAFFDPVVADWNSQARAHEEHEKATADVLLFVLAAPMQEGNPISAYSLVEATMALYDAPERAAVLFDNSGLDGHALRSMKQCAHVLQRRFPAGAIFSDFPSLERWLLSRFEAG